MLLYIPLRLMNKIQEIHSLPLRVTQTKQKGQILDLCKTFMTSIIETILRMI